MEFHVLLSYGIYPDSTIPEMVGDDFKVIRTYRSQNKGIIYLIDGSEERYTFLKIKFGDNSVWKR